MITTNPRETTHVLLSQVDTCNVLNCMIAYSHKYEEKGQGNGIMNNILYIILAVSLVGTLWGNVKKYKENRDQFTRWDRLGSGFAIVGLLCLLAAKIIEIL